MDVRTTSTVAPENMYNYINNLFTDPNFFIIVIVIIIVYIIFFFTLGNSSQSSTNAYESSSSGSGSGSGMDSSNIFITIIIVVIVLLLVINGLYYFFDIDVSASFKNLFTNEPELDITINKIRDEIQEHPFKPLRQKEVFNISGNDYSYSDAKTVCNAYGARLANYDEVENAYNHGGEWCNYGWSKGQNALFPTQKHTFNELQKVKGHEHDCGRPGVNGGYIANPEVKFGVNCFGYKPKITSEEEEMMQNVSPYPKTEKDIEMEKKVDFWKTKINDILVSPFNHTTWSRD